jgi:hypothetical protein
MTMRHRVVAAISALVLVGAFAMPPGPAAARTKGSSNQAGTATNNNSQGMAVQKTKTRPPRAYSGKDPQPAARDQSR